MTQQSNQASLVLYTCIYLYTAAAACLHSSILLYTDISTRNTVHTQVSSRLVFEDFVLMYCGADVRPFEEELGQACTSWVADK